ncbi:receptor-like serine/threonine-protein kinase NCRK isoform X2 [Carya illinoinensis]|uniref:receptor-like serine/threonine-protein kinase NCRK isoform X2 n=1 Tax=Carya illinoinensis TaxID=32201 RepID=UPI001C71BCBA|nr:receptor-like serine/threonine-protein kinase NCRK isoform X2 [Carya illinoinensis]
MKLHTAVAIAYLSSLIWIQQIHCDELSDTSGINKWICKCSYTYQGNHSYAVKSNCSTSCDCIPDSGGNGSTWTCTCTAKGFPKLASENLDTNCFTACQCTYGSLSMARVSKKHISSKVVVIILLLCVILTTFAFLASALCYIYRRDKRPIQAPMVSSDKETSCNSATNLLSLRTSSALESETTIDFSISTFTGCFQNPSSLFRNRRWNIHGTIIQFSYSQLESATKNFSNSNLIGVGGSSYVYHGQLRNGRTVAIKRLKTWGEPDAESLFLTEIELLSRLHHCHVVPLLGYCSESFGKTTERLLVFEYMPNGNLRECLDGNSGRDIDWATRVAIAIGAARGLEYLHEAAAPRVLHSDVKSTNILLDDTWRAKATPRLQDRRRVIMELADPCLNGNFPEEEMQIMAYLAKECLLLDPDDRPTMSEVVQILSTMAPQKSRRRNIPLYFYQRSSPQGIRSGSHIQRPNNQVEKKPVPSSKRSSQCSLQLSAGPIDVEEARLAPLTKESTSCYLPVDVDGILRSENSSKEADSISANYIQSLILLSASVRSCRASDDEMVDLTEPRFESFCMSNIKTT